MARSAAGKRHRFGWIVAVVILAALVAAFFVTDAALRSTAEKRVAKQIDSSLPGGVTAHATVTIGGFSVIAQYLEGSFDQVKLSAPTMLVHGVPIGVHVTARGVPTDRSKPVKQIRGTISLSQDAVDKIVAVPGSTSKVTLGVNRVTYGGTASVLGLDFGYTVTANAKAATNGSGIVLTPSGVKLNQGSASFDLSRVVGAVLKTPIPVCTAGFLPPGVRVTGVSISPARAVITLNAAEVALTGAMLSRTGSCG